MSKLNMEDYKDVQDFLGINLDLTSLDSAVIDANNIELERAMATVQQQLNVSSAKIEQLKSPIALELKKELDSADIKDFGKIYSKILKASEAEDAKLKAILDQAKEDIKYFNKEA